MPKRHVYTLSDAKGIVVITCTNDQQAIAQAKEMFDGNDLVVWEEARLITRLRSATV
jgi:hypothetical protein